MKNKPAFPKGGRVIALFLTLTVGSYSTWAQSEWKDLRLPGNGTVTALASSGEALLAGTRMGQVSADKGKTWKKILTDRTVPFFGTLYIRAMQFAGTTLYLHTSSGVSRARMTEDSLKDSGTPLYLGSTPRESALIAAGNNVLLATDAGLLRSRSSGAPWDTIHSRSLRLIAGAGASLLGIFTNENIVNRSEDGGKTWAYFTDSPPGGFRGLCEHEGLLFGT